ncbi:TIGR03619 family F420-dependent LLM class oxidoreductase [Streptomyces sp. HU2014]|uniref:N5,N10-methylenetetrahydromethanopterin reductase n=1 Tax=Streptomyces albireticuli TaxID=1940 RepID=A0A1Z2L6B3_9ACTN|nr:MULTISPECIES: TIGR03619 family F420-dependent LLM class oxidoreductase [Streptomyces]ARZ69751.1 N5,N10-methylenetetrahydromethanopterin reductase [Streptomyces albireticuli]UQI43363.1 TIGR03619 family F420-dependent LLM class oxidoreductase [Streptomyces sp. HU2014]
MRFGLLTYPVHDGIEPSELGRAAEDLGFESLLFPEHTHIPASRRPRVAECEALRPRSYRVYDPFVALAAVAATTTELRIGTGPSLIAQRDPIILAKETASLDQMSGGRFLFGVGPGGDAEELRNHGGDPDTLLDLMRERVQAVKAIWTQEEASYEGTYVSFRRIWSWPKPRRRPHPPVLVAGDDEGVIDRVIAYGDEWLPYARSPARLHRRAEALRRRARAAGRADIPITVCAGEPSAEDVDEYAALGVHRILLPVTPGPAPQVLEQLKGIAGRLTVAGLG